MEPCRLSAVLSTKQTHLTLSASRKDERSLCSLLLLGQVSVHCPFVMSHRSGRWTLSSEKIEKEGEIFLNKGFFQFEGSHVRRLF